MSSDIGKMVLDTQAETTEGPYAPSAFDERLKASPALAAIVMHDAAAVWNVPGEWYRQARTSGAHPKPATEGHLKTGRHEVRARGIGRCGSHRRSR